MPALVKSLDSATLAALAAYSGTVTVLAPQAVMSHRLSASKVVRAGNGPAKLDWKRARRQARRARRAERESALIEAAEADLGPLTAGQRRDLVKDNFL